MSRTTGSGLLVLGIVLGVAGVIMRFEVKMHTSGFSIHTGGIILLIVGVGCAVIGLVLLFISGRSHWVTQESVQQTPSGEVRTEERSDSGFTP